MPVSRRTRPGSRGGRARGKGARPLPNAPGVAEGMARIEAVKKGVDVDAVFQERLGRTAHDTEALLDRLLAAAPVEGERARPRRLLDAMRYASLGGGKRLRPFLVVESAALFGVARQYGLMAGAALECVHCYSLVHDDLPAMDNDDLQIGRAH